jgi:hypothetical protein
MANLLNRYPIPERVSLHPTNIGDHLELVAAVLNEQAVLAERYRRMTGGFHSCPCARACAARGPVGCLDGDEEKFAVLKRRLPADRYAFVPDSPATTTGTQDGQ